MKRTTSFRAFFTLFLGCVLANGSFADTLADIYELALKNDPVLRSAEATYLAKSEIRTQGRAALLPQITASGEKTETDNQKTGIQTEFEEGVPPKQFLLSTDSDIDATIYTLHVQQNIFNLPAWFSYKQGKQLSRQAEAEFGADQQDLILRVTEAYLDVLRQQDNLSSSLAEEAAIRRQLEQTQQRYDVGLIAITDVHEATAAHDLAIVNRLTDENNLGNAYESLTELTGQPHTNLWVLRDDVAIENPVPTNRDEWVAMALKNNFSLKAKSYAMMAAKHNAKSLKSEHLPKLTGSYTYTDQEQDGTSTINSAIDIPNDDEIETEILGLRLEMPVFTGGLTNSKRRQAAHEFTAAYEDHIASKRKTIQSTRSIYLTTVTDVARVNARSLSITSAKSALDATEAGYDAGTRNIVDLLNAQRDLYRAHRDYANTRYDYINNMLKLKEAAGTLSPEDLYTINKWLKEPDPALKSVNLQGSNWSNES